MPWLTNDSEIDWGTVLDIDRRVFGSLDAKAKLKYIFSTFKLLFLQHPNLCEKKISCDIVFLKSMKRSDYDLLFRSIVSACSKAHHVIDLENKKSFWIRLYPVFILFKYLRTLLSLAEGGGLRSIYLVSRAVYYLGVVEQVRSHISYKHLVVFADMLPIDNLMTQYAKLEKKSTTTLQHGLYVDYSDSPNLNTVNYKNVVAEYFLAWGRETKELINKYHPETVVHVCGKPIGEKSFLPAEPGYLTVIFDQNLFRKENAEMLAIAYEVQEILGIAVNIRFHPANSPSQYRVRKSTTVDRDLYGSRFIIAHTTSMIYEIMRLGMPVYKYDTNVPCVDVPAECKFTTSGELIDKVNVRNISRRKTSEIAARYIQYIDEESLAQYAAYFMSLGSSREEVVSGSSPILRAP